jgi:hypothetical protein
MSDIPSTIVTAHKLPPIPLSRAIVTNKDGTTQDISYEIPYKFSGKKAFQGTADSTVNYNANPGQSAADPIALDDGHQYLVFNGRYVPYKTWEVGENLTVAQAAQRYRDAFFNSIESSTRYALSTEQIEDLLQTYNNLTDDAHRRPTGAIIAGACVERLNEMAKSSVLAEPTADKLASPKISEKSFLSSTVLNSGFKLKTRSGGDDKDGVLGELASEVAISLRRNNHGTAIIQNNTRMNKITKAMNELDTMQEAMEQLSDALPDNAPATKKITKSLLKAHIEYAQARLGVDPDDFPVNIQATIHYKTLRDAIKNVYDNTPDLRIAPNGQPSMSTPAQAVELIGKGLGIIDDISRIRNGMPTRVQEFVEQAQTLSRPEIGAARG